jgi:hypothetical protein
MQDEIISVNAYFGRFGDSYQCTDCGEYLVYQPSGELLHKRVTGIVFKKPVNCRFAGKQFKNPFRNMKLERTT